MSMIAAKDGFAGWLRYVGVIVVAGVSAAAVDGLYFSTTALLHGRSPIRVLQAIASFWLGRAALDGGAASALLGLATHVGLATIMAAVFACTALSLRWLRTHPAAAGAGYGLILYAVMYYGVLPLRWPSHYPRFEGWTSGLDLAVHMAVALSISFIVAGYWRRNPYFA